MSTGVQFGISYSGSTKFQNIWDISVVDVNFEGADADIFTELKKAEKSNEQEAVQYPKFQIIKKNDKALLGSSDKLQVDSIHVGLVMAKTIRLSARIFKIGKTSARRDNLPISLKEFPKFEEGKSYKIQVENRDDNLIGTIIEISEQELKRQVKSQELSEKRCMGEQLFNAGIQNFITAMGAIPYMEPAVSGFAALGQSMQAKENVFDDLNVPELEARLNTANIKLNEARVNFQIALQIGEQTVIMKKLQEKQEIMQEVMCLSKALERKGILIQS